MSHFGAQHPLRRALIGGYRVADVEVALAQLRLLASQLDTELRTTRERLESVEADRTDMRRRLDEAHTRELEMVETASELHRAKEEFEQSAAQRWRELEQRAEAEAAEIRAGAARDAEVARSQLEELRRLRESLNTAMRGIVSDFEGVIGAIDRGPDVHLNDRPPEAQPPRTLMQPVPAAARGTARPSASPSLFERQIELEAGPFSDFSSLSAFERSLGALPNVEDVYIRRFEGDRATIDVRLLEPAALLEEMNERMPYLLAVESAVSDRISVTVSQAAAAG